MNELLIFNPFEKFRYFTTAINIRTPVSNNNKGREKKYALIGLKNIENGRYKIHPVTEYIITGKNLNKKFLTMKKKADQIVPFLNYTFVEKYPNFRIRKMADLSFDHGSDFLNYKGSGVSRETVNRYERTLTEFYYFLARKELTNNFKLKNFLYRKTKIKGKPITYIQSPFEGVIHPDINFKSSLLHDFPDELLFHFIFEAQRIAPHIAFGMYCQSFGGLRIGELMNLKKSSLIPIGLNGRDGLIARIRQRRPKEKFSGSTHYDGVKVERDQIILPVYGFIESLYRNHFAKYTATDGTNGLFANKFGGWMTSDSYRYYYNKVKESFIKRLIYHERAKVRIAGLMMRSERWDTHILRSKFTHIVVENCDTPFDVMRFRGDKHIDSVIDYLNNSPKIQKRMIEVINRLFNNES